MKSLSDRLEVILLVISLAIFPYAEVWGLDWKHYGTNKEGAYFYERESMTRPSKNSVRVWVQSAYTEKGVSDLIREGGKEFENLDLSLILFDLNCADKAIWHLRIVFYSKNGEVFYSVPNDEWQFFVPDSMSEALFKAVCK
jgi:hypothetical protein